MSIQNEVKEFTTESVSFVVEGDRIHGTKYMPAHRSGDVPVVVMAHGWSMVAGGDLEDYAAKIAERGLAVLTFDFRNLGKSEGEPRQEIDPQKQLEDYRSAVSFVRTWDGIDKNRIGAWGSSYSGGHVLVLAAVDPRVTCVVSQVPTISGYQAGLRRAPAEKAKVLADKILADREARFAGESPQMVMTVSLDPNDGAAYPQQDSYEYMTSEGERCPTWRNEVTLRSVEFARQYEPGNYISRITKTPLLMIIADDDPLTPTDLQLDAYNKALEPKKLFMVPGGHYSVYRDHFDKTSGAAADWFEAHLTGGQAS